MIDPILYRALLAALAMILLAGAISKLRDVHAWFGAVEQYGLISSHLIRHVGILILAAEFAGGSLLLWPPTRAAGAMVAVLLLVIVTGAVIVNLRRGRADIRCGCGGIGSDQRLSRALVVRNLVLLACASLLQFPELPRVLSSADQVFSVAGALVLAGLYATANQVLATEPRLSQLRRE